MLTLDRLETYSLHFEKVLLYEKGNKKKVEQKKKEREKNKTKRKHKKHAHRETHLKANMYNGIFSPI